MRFTPKLGSGLATVGVAAVVAWAVLGGGGPVGAATDAGGTAAGGTWGLSQPLPGVAAFTVDGSLPRGPIEAITCTTPGNCVAVGYSVTESGATAAPFVATETSGTWESAQPVSGADRLGDGAGAQLAKVSCGVTGDCTATGVYNGTDRRAHAFYVSEKSGAWGPATPVSEAGLPAGSYSTITGVSCPAVGYCAIVGNYVETGGIETPFTLDETDGTWGSAPQPVPGLAGLPSAGSSATLESVSCAAPEDCTAGGGYIETASVDQPFVVSESAGTWTSAEQVSGVSSGFVQAVACPDETDCTVAGIAKGPSSYDQAFTTDERQGTWGTADLINNPSLISMYADPLLACAAAGNCVLADTAGIETGPDDAHPGAVADSEISSGHWGTVTPIAVPASPHAGVATTSGVLGLSCAPGGDCTLAGYYDTAANPAPVDTFAVTSADGVPGNLQSLSPALEQTPAIVGLACPASGYCTLAYNLSGAPKVVSEATAATVTLTSSAPTVTYGSESAQTLTATVSSPAGGTPTGTVTVTGPDGVALCAITLSGGTGNCGDAGPALPGGANTLTATYSGDATYVAASGTTRVTVKGAATTTSLGISPVSATFTGKDMTVTFSTTVTSTAGTPTGIVSVNGQGVGSCDWDTLNVGKDTCTSTIWMPTPGRHALTVNYVGNADFAPSQSATQYLTVSKAKTTTTLTLSKTSVTYGHESAEKLTVSVSHVGSVYPTGKVAVRIGGTTICTITLNKGTGHCALGNTRLRAGSYRLLALYSGNGDYNASSSASKTLRISG